MIIKKHSLFDKFIFALTIVSSLILLLSYIAGIADPQKFWIIAIIGLLYPFLLVSNLLLVVYWLFRSKWYALIPTVCILTGFKILIVNYGFNIPSSPKSRPAGAIKMMAYNVHGFLDIALTNKAQDSILKLINIEQPDILNVEEFSINVNTTKAIYSSLKKTMKPAYYYFKPYEHTPYDSSGLAIFSKYPIVNKGTVFATPDTSENQAIFADVKREGKIFRVYCIHLQSVRFEDKEHIYLRKLTHYGKVSVPELKIVKNKLKIAFINRSYQAAVIRGHMEHCPYPYMIAGDFNDTPISYAVNKIGSGLSNAFKDKGCGLGFTYYGDFPNLQIDYIFASKEFKVINYQCIHKKLSDHYPIISDLFLTPN